jgi:serine/threonine protein kinase
VVRVNGALESTLYDEQRKATELLVPDLLKNGSTIDGLVVTALVSDSGVYRLYQVREPSTQKLYALKTLHKSRAHDREECLTLAHEAWVAKRMQTGPARKNLAQLIDWPAAAAKLNASPLQDQTQSFFYLLYEWHSGETLEQIIKSKREIEIAQIVYWITEATKALGFIHRQGVVHRDIKPANLHLGEDSVLRVLDFGVAMSGKDRADSRYLLAGSPSYMNPEQWPGYSKNSPPEGSLPDIQSDLYALGVTLYQLLTNGKLPYGEILPYQIGRYSKDPLAPSRHNPKVPIWLDHIVLKAVAKNKDHRFETAEEMVLALERGAIRPLSAPGSTAYLQRDPASVWKLLLAISALINFALIYWVVFALK